MRLARVLEQIAAERGLPQAIRCDNGAEMTGRHFLAWCLERKIERLHIGPGRPVENGRIEGINGRLREECLRTSWFYNLFDARRKIAAWRHDYNHRRPHSRLGYRTPAEFAAHGEASLRRPDVGQGVSLAGPVRLAPIPALPTRAMFSGGSILI